jgi:hypothetical protein
MKHIKTQKEKELESNISGDSYSSQQLKEEYPLLSNAYEIILKELKKR